MLTDPGVLNSLNGFLNKKTATRLLAVCKIMKEYIKPKCYRELVLKLDTLNVLRIERAIAQKLPFDAIKNQLVLFQRHTRIRNWTQRQQAINVSYEYYAYSLKIINYLIFNYRVNGSIQNINSSDCKCFMDFYNIIKTYPLPILIPAHDYFEDEITYY
jgi:hypothetical protein